MAQNLNFFRESTHSQYGEDGILRRLFEHKGIVSGYFCEFGAWDGRHLSNTFLLYELGWRGCYIEGDRSRFEDLRKNITRTDMDLMCVFVSTTGPNCLDSILKDRSVDLLSIDIDSDDLAMWRSLTTIRPRVVVIEFNPTIPFDTRYENPEGRNHGNSALSIFEFASGNAYELVAVTHCNLIFIDRQFNGGSFQTFGLNEFAAGVRYFFCYDGTLVAANLETGVASSQELFVVPWTSTVFPQPVMRSLRSFDERTWRNRLSGGLSLITATIRRPLSVLAGLFERRRRQRRRA